MQSTHALLSEVGNRKLYISRYPNNSYLVRFETTFEDKDQPLISDLYMSQEAFQMLQCGAFEFCTNIDKFKCDNNKDIS